MSETIDGQRYYNTGDRMAEQSDDMPTIIKQLRAENERLKSIIDPHLDKDGNFDKHGFDWECLKWKDESDQLRAENQRQAEQIDSLKKKLHHSGYCMMLEDNNKLRVALRRDNERLKEFAQKVIKAECWDYDSLDGCDIQDLAEKLGLIKKCMATEADVDDRSDYGVGDMIYKFTETLKD